MSTLIRKFMEFLAALLLFVVLVGGSVAMFIHVAGTKPLPPAPMSAEQVTAGGGRCTWAQATMGKVLYAPDGLALVMVQTGLKGEIFAKTWEGGIEHERVYRDQRSAFSAFGRTFTKECT